MILPSLIEQSDFVLQALDLSIFDISSLLSFDGQPEPVYYLVSEECKGEGLEEGATMGAIEVVLLWPRSVVVILL